jgi:hypothetical protein
MTIPWRILRVSFQAKGRFQVNHTSNEPIYEFRVKGRLTDRWLKSFAGMSLVYRDGDTYIVGPVPDQSTLHGMLIAIGDYGMTLQSVRRLDERE